MIPSLTPTETPRRESPTMKQNRRLYSVWTGPLWSPETPPLGSGVKFAPSRMVSRDTVYLECTDVGCGVRGNFIRSKVSEKNRSPGTRRHIPQTPSRSLGVTPATSRHMSLARVDVHSLQGAAPSPQVYPQRHFLPTASLSDDPSRDTRVLPYTESLLMNPNLQRCRVLFKILVSVSSLRDHQGVSDPSYLLTSDRRFLSCRSTDNTVSRGLPTSLSPSTVLPRVRTWPCRKTQY